MGFEKTLRRRGTVSSRQKQQLKKMEIEQLDDDPRLRSQTESRYVQTVPDGKCLCPDRPRQKVPMSRLSCVHQTFVRSCPDFRAFMSRLSCVHQTFVRSCPDFRAFMSRLPCVHVQTFVRSCPDFRAFTIFLCVHVQTFVCVHHILVRSCHQLDASGTEKC